MGRCADQSRPSFSSVSVMDACVLEGCVDAPLPRINTKQLEFTRCSFIIIIKSGFCSYGRRIGIIYWYFVFMTHSALYLELK